MMPLLRGETAMRFETMQVGSTWVVVDTKTGNVCNGWSTVRAEMERVAARKNRRQQQ
jgi:hypothetical protein